MNFMNDLLVRKQNKPWQTWCFEFACTRLRGSRGWGRGVGVVRCLSAFSAFCSRPAADINLIPVGNAARSVLKISDLT